MIEKGKLTEGNILKALTRLALPIMATSFGQMAYNITNLRVPFALILSRDNILGLNGVWWSISISSVFKGVVLMIWFIFILKKFIYPYIENDNNLHKNTIMK